MSGKDSLPQLGPAAREIMDRDHVYPREAARYRELKNRVNLFEQPDGRFRHWLLLSIESESPDFDEAVDELIAKRTGGK